MYLITRTKTFEKSFKKLAKSGFAKKNKLVVELVIDKIASGRALDKKYKDHALSGQFADYRECHNLNDLLLVNKIEKKELIIKLIKIGSHSQLFG